MNEYLVGLLAAGKIMWTVLFAILYMLGGRKGKWIRRFVGGSVFPLGICGFALVHGTFHWVMLAGVGTYIGALVLGYGGKTLGIKLLRRSLFGLALGAAGIPFVVTIGGIAWLLFGIQVALAVTVSIVLGIFNPVKAAEEESYIAALSVILVPLYVGILPAGGM